MNEKANEEGKKKGTGTPLKNGIKNSWFMKKGKADERRENW